MTSVYIISLSLSLEPSVKTTITSTTPHQEEGKLLNLPYADLNFSLRQITAVCIKAGHVTETKKFDLKTFESYLTQFWVNQWDLFRFTTQLTLPEVLRPPTLCNYHKIRMLVFAPHFE